MSKMTNSLNQLWYQKDGDVFNMGLTRNFLESLDECWHILPTNTSRVKEKSPLFTIETNDSLLSILSPVAGNFLNWNDRATNFPDKLTEADVIIKLSTKEIAKPEPLTGLDDEAEIARLTAIVIDSSLPVATRVRANSQIQAITAARAALAPRPVTAHPAGVPDWTNNMFRPVNAQPRRTNRQPIPAQPPTTMNDIRTALRGNAGGILGDGFDEQF